MKPTRRQRFLEYVYAALAGLGLGALLCARVLPDHWWRLPLLMAIGFALWCVTTAIIWQPFGRRLKEWQG